jgi:hypothetical protein
MAVDKAALAELDIRIMTIRENLIELTEQAAAYSGGADEDLASKRLAQQEEELARLTRQRDELVKGG